MCDRERSIRAGSFATARLQMPEQRQENFLDRIFRVMHADAERQRISQ